MTPSAQSTTQRTPTTEEQGAILSALQPIYTALMREFVIEVSASPIDENFSSSAETIEDAETWFQQVDAEIQVHQLRQFLQTTPLANETVLRNLLLHHMRKATKSASDRDKTDFLLVQYFSLCAPTGLSDADLELAYVAQVLEPVLGPQEPPQEIKIPEWLNTLETILQSATRSRRLSELLHSGTLEQGRKLKTQNASRYFEPAAMVAFTRFNFMIRRIFFRLMHDDLNAIQDGLRDLEHAGIATIDCRRAQFSAGEPIARLRMICQSWKVMFHAEYSSGQPLRMLVDLRAAVDDALQNGALQTGTQEKGAQQNSTSPNKTKNTLAASAAAGAGGSGTAMKTKN
jgi:hypothetical protein